MVIKVEIGILSSCHLSDLRNDCRALSGFRVGQLCPRETLFSQEGGTMGRPWPRPYCSWLRGICQYRSF